MHYREQGSNNIRMGLEKVMCIGLPKTGTTSLKSALTILGYNVGPIKDEECNAHVGDAMCLPTHRYIKLHEDYPDAKFILTLRSDPNTWYESVKRWADKKKDNKGILKQRKSMYGFEMPVRKPFIEQYVYHAQSVHNFFFFRYPDLSRKLLIVCWEDGDGWEEICSFLDKPIPDIPFPHKNKNK